MSENAFKYLDEPIRPGSFISKGMEIGPMPGMWGSASGAGALELGTKFYNWALPSDDKNKGSK